MPAFDFFLARPIDTLMGIPVFGEAAFVMCSDLKISRYGRHHEPPVRWIVEALHGSAAAEPNFLYTLAPVSPRDAQSRIAA
jgi:hypothetical protein